MSRNQVPTPKQARFIAEYVKDLNGTKAAVRADFSERSARAIANELFTKPHIQNVGENEGLKLVELV